MTTRISNLGAMQSYLSRVLQIQSRVQDEQVQIATQKKAELYSGIGGDTNRVINLENEKSFADHFLATNAVANTRLTAAQTSVSAVETSVKNFREQLMNFQQGSTTDQLRVNQIQDFAYRSLKDVADYLAASVNGEYIFAGGRTSTNPVQLPAVDLKGFQALYDGSDRSVSVTRTAQLLDTTTNQKETGAITFDPANGVITATKAGGLATIPASSNITIGNSLDNNNPFTVTRQAVQNNSGALVSNGTDNTASITMSNGQVISAATAGGLNFAISQTGMVMTAGNATALASIQPGMSFTLTSSPAGLYDGTYRCTTNTNGSVEFVVDNAQFASESAQNVTAKLDTNADGIGDSGFTLTNPVTFQTDPNGGGILMSSGDSLNDTAGVNAGDTITLTGTKNHTGSYRVVTKNADGSLVLAVSSPALQVSKFAAQIGRTDVTVEGFTPKGTPPLSIKFNAANYGSVDFDPNGATGETLTAANPNSFVDTHGVPFPPAGAVLNLKSTSGVNDGSYEVVSNDGQHIVIKSSRLNSEIGSTTANISSSSWYKGDNLITEHRVDIERSIQLGINAEDPAFEKAVRAMMLIAQGNWGTAGGLDNHAERVDQALYLLNDALNSPAAGTPPFGPEERNDLNQVAAQIGFNMQTIKDTDNKHTQFSAFLEERIGNIENVNVTEAIALFNSDTNSLQASYKALAQVKDMTLLNYLR